jgi:excisionase family DNA binding protein
MRLPSPIREEDGPFGRERSTREKAAADIQRLLSSEEVAELFGVSRAWVLAHANGSRRPVLPSIKLGKVVRFNQSAVQRFIEECTR